MNYIDFANNTRAKLIAPAGYGKSFTITECLKHTIGKQLILTHTHAGIASLKEKLKSAQINSDKYSVETIMSFAQKYVHAYYVRNDIPAIEEKNYHEFILHKAKIIAQLSFVKKVIQFTYSGIFVDEYQDCNKEQHDFILTLANYLPIRVLGDPLQGIFDFNGELVDFDRDLANFENFPELEYPARWYMNNNNPELGDLLKKFRALLLNNEPITIDANDDIGFHVYLTGDNDLRDAKSNYRKYLSAIIINSQRKDYLNSLLILVPEYIETKADGTKIRRGDIAQRAQIKSIVDYTNQLRLLESIDEKLFYKLAKNSDALISNISKARKPINLIKKELLENLFNSTDINLWFNDTGLKSKRDVSDQVITKKFSMIFENFVNFPSPYGLTDIVNFAAKICNMKYKRAEALQSLISALNISALQGINVYDAMVGNRNRLRRSGRKVLGKCLGTTLLTKGLEFDTVVIMDAHKFDSAQHLYVALTRARKRLIIFSQSNILKPYES